MVSAVASQQEASRFDSRLGPFCMYAGVLSEDSQHACWEPRGRETSEKQARVGDALRPWLASRLQEGKLGPLARNGSTKPVRDGDERDNNISKMS